MPLEDALAFCLRGGGHLRPVLLRVPLEVRASAPVEGFTLLALAVSRGFSSLPSALTSGCLARTFSSHVPALLATPALRAEFDLAAFQTAETGSALHPLACSLTQRGFTCRPCGASRGRACPSPFGSGLSPRSTFYVPFFHATKKGLRRIPYNFSCQ